MATSVTLDNDLKHKLQRLADVRRLSVNGIIIEALNEYVERRETRDSFRQEAMNSWEDFQRTGKHLTGNEVNTWLKTWGTENETTIPKCHD